MTTRRDAGLTLLELVVAIAVLGFVLAAVTQGFRFGAQATRLAAAPHDTDMLAIDQAFRRLVGRADPGIYPEPATLRGTQATLELTTELPTAAGSQQLADAMISAVDGRLVLRWRPHRHAEWFGPGPPWTETVLADAIDHVDFAFWPPSPGFGWSPAWNGDHLPALVRLRLTFLGQRGPWPPIIAAPLREPIDE